MSQPEPLSPDVMERIKGIFFQDCKDLQGELETALLALKKGERDPELVTAIFRVAHSVKGGGRNFELKPLAVFSQLFESVVARVRSSQLALDDEIVVTLQRAADVLADHIQAAQSGDAIDAARANDVELALAKLAPPKAAAEPLEAVQDNRAPSAETSTRCWRIDMRPHRTLYAKANETLALLRALHALGEATVELNDERIPLLKELEPEQAYLSWSILLLTEHDEPAIREVFELVERDCDIELKQEAVKAAPATYAVWN